MEILKFDKLYPEFGRLEVLIVILTLIVDSTFYANNFERKLKHINKYLSTTFESKIVQHTAECYDFTTCLLGSKVNINVVRRFLIVIFMVSDFMFSGKMFHSAASKYLLNVSHI